MRGGHGIPTAELEILWTPAAVWALRSFDWRDGELLDAAVQRFARSGEGRVTRVEESSLRMRLHVPPYVVRFDLDQDKGVLVVVWIWRQS